MRWDRVRFGFYDELEKIAEVNLSGLSPDTVLKNSAPLPPMETAGFSKARDILGRAEQAKTASVIPGSAVGMPQMQRFKDEERKDPSAMGQAKSLAGHTLAGAGAGRLVGWASHGPKLGVTEAAKQSLHGRQWYGTAIGAGIGAGTYGLRKLREKQMEKRQEMVKVSFGSPAMALQASRKTARMAKGAKTPLRSGKGVLSQASGTIGDRFKLRGP